MAMQCRFTSGNLIATQNFVSKYSYIAIDLARYN